ncbi:sulfotransferase 1C2-like [Saccostrea echinata]|uniref:sulfotransferase 1C2-like n=1 Tax=Saccostrea echinata TaxID=191078 RepID=UPI002A82CD6E|nr:sulfotransferase 1C2-like [Saccostrea echinata]
MILQQSAEYIPREKNTHMLEFNTPEVLESMTSPRVFNTHLRPNNLPQQFFQKRCKTVFVQRNPKDVAVSFYYHCRDKINFRGTFLQFMDFFLEKHGLVYHSAWPLYTLEWEKYFKEHPDHPVHCIMYEDLQQDPVSEIKRLVAFLDKPCDDQLAKQIAEKCSFQNLKAASTNLKETSGSVSMYRKGKVGDWKNHFTVALNEEFDQYLQQNKTDSRYMEDASIYGTTVSKEDVIKVADGHGNIMELIESGGQCLNATRVLKGNYPNPKTNFPKLKEMNVSSDDFFLCAYPKAGTHWTWEIMSMLLKQSAEYHLKEKESYMLEFHTPEVLESTISPRVFNTHFYPSNLPKQMLQKRCKVVFVQRNPKDVSVSFYHHCVDKINFHGSFEQYMDFFMEKHEAMYFCAWTTYTLAWEKYIKEHPDHPVHCIMYEDLQQDPISEIKRLALFMDKPCDEELASIIAEKCSFQNLKTAAASVKEDTKGVSLYRKGKVGDWRNYFTVALNEEFDKYLQRHKTDSVYKYKI